MAFKALIFTAAVMSAMSSAAQASVIDLSGLVGKGWQSETSLTAKPTKDAGPQFSITVPTDEQYEVSFTAPAGSSLQGLTFYYPGGHTQFPTGIGSYDFSWSWSNGLEPIGKSYDKLWTSGTDQNFQITPDSGDTATFSVVNTRSSVGPLEFAVRVDAVPEPATWAMMLIGFGGLGAALRMNRRRPSPIAA